MNQKLKEMANLYKRMDDAEQGFFHDLVHRSKPDTVPGP
jgi:hypothetical protein